MGKKFKRLIVHVGMHKTGSTTLQEVISQMGRGPAGPMDMIDVNHSLPCNLWFGPVLEQPKNLLILGHSRETGERHLARIKRRVARQLRWSWRRELVISGEWLSSGGVPGQGRDVVLQRLKDEFEPYFDRIEVYGYVRAPAAYITSATQQIMKMKPVFQVAWPNYKRRFSPLFRVFGRENVHLRLFDRKHLVGGDVTTDFQQWVGWPQVTVRVSPKNTTLSAAGASLVNCYQRNRPEITTVLQHRARNKIVAKLTEVDGPRFALARDITDALVQKNRPDLDWMERILGQTIDDSGKGVSENSHAFGSEEDLKRAAAQFAPLLHGGTPQAPPDDPDAADALAWAALKEKFRL
ncbi:MAG: hypothetical protein AAFY25_00065 [Pseudomonadota bacterium]